MSAWDNGPDDRQGELLARVLSAEADTVVPAGDGLERIRGRVARRRARRRWLRPTLTIATVGAVTAGAFAGFQLTGGNVALKTDRTRPAQSGSHAPVTPVPTTPRVTTPAPSTTPGSSAPSAPTTLPVTVPIGSGSSVAPVWPFTSYAAAMTWQSGAAGQGHQPWHLDAGMTALDFLHNGAGISDSLRVLKDTATGHATGDVVVGDSTTASGATVVITVVHVARYGSGSTAPYEVTGADAPNVTLTSPVPGSTVTSPLPVTGTSAAGVDQAFEVTVHPAGSAASLGTGHATYGQGPFSGSATFSTPAGGSGGSGFVTFVDRSQSGVGISRFATVAVSFDHAGVPGTTPPATPYPPTFVAVQDGRVRLFFAQGGGAGRWLTDPQPGGGVQAAAVTDDRGWVYYLQGDGSCAESLLRVRYDGTGSPQQVVSGADPVIAFAVAGDHGQYLAWVVKPCSGADSVLHWRNADTGAQGTVTGFTGPPEIEQLALSPDGKQVTAHVRTGTQGGLYRFDLATARTVDDHTVVDCAAGGGCMASAYAPGGDLVYAMSDGSQIVVYRLHGSSRQTLFHVAANGAQPTLDVSADGRAIVLGDGLGRIWRWTSGAAQALPTKATSPTW